MVVLQCIFCEETGKQNIKQLSEERLSSAKSTSERRQDNFFDPIEQLKQDGSVIASHRDCLSTYTSKTHIVQNSQLKTHKTLKKRRQDGKDEEADSKKSRRSTKSAFDFRTYCLFCGKRWQEKDPKHPDRWRKYYIN